MTKRNETETMKVRKMRDVNDGTSRNGYHKVKCQVPETEELKRREKRLEKNISKTQVVRRVIN